MLNKAKLGKFWLSQAYVLKLAALKNAKKLNYLTNQHIQVRLGYKGMVKNNL